MIPQSSKSKVGRCEAEPGATGLAGLAIASTCISGGDAGRAVDGSCAGRLTRNQHEHRQAQTVDSPRPFPLISRESAGASPQPDEADMCTGDLRVVSAAEWEVSKVSAFPDAVPVTSSSQRRLFDGGLIHPVCRGGLIQPDCCWEFEVDQPSFSGSREGPCVLVDSCRPQGSADEAQARDESAAPHAADGL